jgi:hypothetical protein
MLGFPAHAEKSRIPEGQKPQLKIEKPKSGGSSAGNSSAIPMRQNISKAERQPQEATKVRQATRSGKQNTRNLHLKVPARPYSKEEVQEFLKGGGKTIHGRDVDDLEDDR